MGLFKNFVLRKADKYRQKDMAKMIGESVKKPIASERYHVNKWVVERMQRSILDLQNTVRLLKVAAGVKEIGLSLKKMNPQEQVASEKMTEHLSPAKTSGSSDVCESAC